MRLKVLGAYGASDAEHNLTGYLLDDWFAVDAGTLTSKLSFAQQARIQGVFITHSHADHIRDLPHLIHNRFKIIRIGVNSAVVEDTTNKNEQTLPLIEELPG